MPLSTPRLAVLIAAVALATGCSVGSFSSKKVDYKQANTLPPLEVPPDLSSPVVQSDGLPALASLRSGSSDEVQPAARVLPKKLNVEVRGRGDQRWLTVDADADKVWEQVRDYWLKNGFELKVEEPAIGLIETQWAENRADVPEGFLRGALSKAFSGLYSAPTRDKFRVRLERIDEGTTEVYLTHYGVEQVVTTDTAGEASQAIWRPRPSDPELANEMLNRITAFLGVGIEQAETMVAVQEDPRAVLQSAGGDPVLDVRENFARAWRRTGLALDRIGFVVEDRNRSEGTYYVRQVDQLADAGVKGEKKGFFASLFSSDDEEVATEVLKGRVLVEPVGEERTRLSVRDENGAAVTPQQAESLLKRLEQQLR